MNAVGFTHGFFIDATQYYPRLTSIFSKHPVKTYPPDNMLIHIGKIIFHGTAFEQLDSYLFLPLHYRNKPF
jgi:hypothetical protein